MCIGRPSIALALFLAACTPEPATETPEDSLAADSPPAQSQPAQSPATGTLSPDVAGSRAVFEQARRRGIEFRAVGQEPGWTLEIDRDVNGVLDFTGDYGAIRVIAPVPEPVHEVEGASWYRVETDARTLRVRLSAEPCEDTMSGEVFSYTVMVEIDGRTLHGCGRELSRGR
jgi:uncharacterized membrane protein